MTDAGLARALAVDVVDLRRRIRDEGVEDGAALGKRGDREANALILARLAIERPDDAVLSEEANDDRSRCAVSRVWVIDPLDGTRAYGERRDDWAVHIRLAVYGRPTLGAVAIPARGEVFVRDTVASPRSTPARPITFGSRTLPPAIVGRAAADDGAAMPALGIQ